MLRRCVDEGHYVDQTNGTCRVVRGHIRTGVYTGQVGVAAGITSYDSNVYVSTTRCCIFL